MNSYDNEFIKFDTVKIKTSINYFIGKNVEFSKNCPNGILIGEYYISKNEKYGYWLFNTKCSVH